MKPAASANTGWERSRRTPGSRSPYSSGPACSFPSGLARGTPFRTASRFRSTRSRVPGPLRVIGDHGHARAAAQAVLGGGLPRPVVRNAVSPRSRFAGEVLRPRGVGAPEPDPRRAPARLATPGNRRSGYPQSPESRTSRPGDPAGFVLPGRAGSPGEPAASFGPGAARAPAPRRRVVDRRRDRRAPRTDRSTRAPARTHAAASRYGVNLYASWRPTPALEQRWDTHDIFVLQVCGRKHWRVHAPCARIRSPTTSSRRPAPRTKPTWDGMLRRETCSISHRGWWHSAAAVERPSLHLTVGVYKRTGLDLVDWLRRQLRDGEVFRRDVPRLASPDAQSNHLERPRRTLRRVEDTARPRPVPPPIPTSRP